MYVYSIVRRSCVFAGSTRSGPITATTTTTTNHYSVTLLLYYFFTLLLYYCYNYYYYLLLLLFVLLLLGPCFSRGQIPNKQRRVPRQFDPRDVKHVKL